MFSPEYADPLFTGWMTASFLMIEMCYFCAENSDISSALSKLTDPSGTVPIHKLSVSKMVHSARKHIRRHRHMDESPLNTGVLNSIMLVSECFMVWNNGFTCTCLVIVNVHTSFTEAKEAFLLNTCVIVFFSPHVSVSFSRCCCGEAK